MLLLSWCGSSTDWKKNIVGRGGGRCGRHSNSYEMASNEVQKVDASA
jgi:hypothetical protein